MTTRPRTPASPHCARRRRTTALAGTAITARSGTSGQIEDGRVGAHRLHRCRRWVYGVDNTLEVAGEDVVEDLAADRPAAARRADHGDCARCEHEVDCSDAGDLLAAARNAPSQPRWSSVGRATQMTSAPTCTSTGNPLSRNNLDHPVVVGPHDGGEGLDPLVVGAPWRGGRAAPVREAATLARVGDRKRHLGPCPPLLARTPRDPTISPPPPTVAIRP